MKLVKYIILLNMLCVLVGCSVAKKSNRLTDYVNPFIGNADNGHTFPGACAPFGLIQASPDPVSAPGDTVRDIITMITLSKVSPKHI